VSIGMGRLPQILFASGRHSIARRPRHEPRPRAIAVAASAAPLCRHRGPPPLTTERDRYFLSFSSLMNSPAPALFNFPLPNGNSAKGTILRAIPFFPFLSLFPYPHRARVNSFTVAQHFRSRNFADWVNWNGGTPFGPRFDDVRDCRRD
jgi:hypothetical protein